MKKYVLPEIELEEIQLEDVIAESSGEIGGTQPGDSEGTFWS